MAKAAGGGVCLEAGNQSQTHSKRGYIVSFYPVNIDSYTLLFSVRTNTPETVLSHLA